jgi:hypothetical protein
MQLRGTESVELYAQLRKPLHSVVVTTSAFFKYVLILILLNNWPLRRRPPSSCGKASNLYLGDNYNPNMAPPSRSTFGNV